MDNGLYHAQCDGECCTCPARSAEEAKTVCAETLGWKPEDHPYMDGLTVIQVAWPNPKLER